jgi:hypothetical protein
MAESLFFFLNKAIRSYFERVQSQPRIGFIKESLYFRLPRDWITDTLEFSSDRDGGIEALELARGRSHICETRW